MQTEALDAFYKGQQPVVNEHHYKIITNLPEIMPVKLFEKHFGTTANAVSSRLDSGTWSEGKEVVYDAQGGMHVVLEEYYTWAKSGKSKRKPSMQGLGLGAAASPSTLGGTVSAIGKRPLARSHKAGSKPLPVYDQQL